MYLRSLYLHNFRSYGEAFFEFSPGINVVFGPNASGKTTLLEAIYFLIAGRSFRMAQTSDLIRQGAARFHIEACFVKNDLEQRLKISSNGLERRILYNSTVYPNFTSLLGLLKGIVLCPDDAALIKGGPAVRRHYLDLQIAQVDPLYVHHLTRFNRAMRQRNHLLRTKNLTAIESWEYEMAHSAAYLVKQRVLAVGELRAACQRLYEILAGQQISFSVAYKTSAPSEGSLDTLQQYYTQRFHSHRSREIQLGYTLNGPHKDDLTIEIDSREARFFGSEGQQRSGVAALRLAEWERIRERGEDIPIMLIDDVGTSLDETRKAYLLKHVQNLGQVFLSSNHELYGKQGAEGRLGIKQFTVTMP